MTSNVIKATVATWSFADKNKNRKTAASTKLVGLVSPVSTPDTHLIVLGHVGNVLRPPKAAKKQNYRLKS